MKACSHLYARSYQEGSHRKYVFCELCKAPARRDAEGWDSGLLAKLIGPDRGPRGTEVLPWFVYDGDEWPI